MSSKPVNYVGLDVHASECSVCVINDQQQVLFETTCPTNGSELVQILGAIAPPVEAILEETTIADWVYRVLESHLRRVVITDPRQNALIAQDQHSDDRSAAHKLARLLQAGFVHPVHHGAPERQEFKRLVLFYHKQARTLVRLRNQLKAIFRSYAICCPGAAVYQPEQREKWLAKLPAGSAAFRAGQLLGSIDQVRQTVADTRREIARQARHFPQIKAFQEAPGMGLIRSATFFALIDTPDRFLKKGHAWAYCGIGIARRQSAGVPEPPHLNRNGNPLLKDVIKGAVVVAISTKGRFESQYARLVAEHHSPELARLTVARSLINTLMAMWRTGQPYRPHFKSDELLSRGAME